MTQTTMNNAAMAIVKTIENVALAERNWGLLGMIKDLYVYRGFDRLFEVIAEDVASGEMAWENYNIQIVDDYVESAKILARKNYVEKVIEAIWENTLTELDDADDVIRSLSEIWEVDDICGVDTSEMSTFVILPYLTMAREKIGCEEDFIDDRTETEYGNDLMRALTSGNEILLQIRDNYNGKIINSIRVQLKSKNIVMNGKHYNSGKSLWRKLERLVNGKDITFTYRYI